MTHTVHIYTWTPKAWNVILIISSLLFSSQQVAERWPLFFVRPSFTTGAPREFSQRDPGNVLLPGGGDISQPCITDQLSLCSPSLYEESLLQHRDHVSKRNKSVGPITQTRRHEYSWCERLDLNLQSTQDINHTDLWICQCIMWKLGSQTCGMACMKET